MSQCWGGSAQRRRRGVGVEVVRIAPLLEPPSVLPSDLGALRPRQCAMNTALLFRFFTKTWRGDEACDLIRGSNVAEGAIVCNVAFRSWSRVVAAKALDISEVLGATGGGLVGDEVIDTDEWHNNPVEVEVDSIPPTLLEDDSRRRCE